MSRDGSRGVFPRPTANYRFRRLLSRWCRVGSTGPTSPNRSARPAASTALHPQVKCRAVPKSSSPVRPLPLVLLGPLILPGSANARRPCCAPASVPMRPPRPMHNMLPPVYPALQRRLAVLYSVAVLWNDPTAILDWDGVAGGHAGLIGTRPRCWVERPRVRQLPLGAKSAAGRARHHQLAARSDGGCPARHGYVPAQMYRTDRPSPART